MFSAVRDGLPLTPITLTLLNSLEARMAVPTVNNIMELGESVAAVTGEFGANEAL